MKITCNRCGCDLDVDVGVWPGRTPPKICCDSCYDLIEKEETAAAKSAAEAAAIARREDVLTNYRTHAARSGLPPVYHGAALDGIEMEPGNREGVSAAGRFIAAPVTFLYMFGAAGRGKTWIAAALFRELLLSGVKVRFIRAVDLLDELRASVGDNTSRETMEELRTWPVLIIDDLAAERPTDWTVEQLYSLLDYRYSWGLGTVITSNANGAELAKIFGARVVSRIKGAGEAIEIKGADRRLKPKGDQS